MMSTRQRLVNLERELSVKSGKESHAIYISDLHFSSARPQVVSLATKFIKDIATRTNYLFILGDLFEYWIGDDDTNQEYLDGFLAELSLLHGIGTEC